MLGAIAGDIIGSRYEGSMSPGAHFTLFAPRSNFTDDSVLSIAVAHALRTGLPFDAALRNWARRYPNAGYGVGFQRWFESDVAGPYGSNGNGSAMRVAPVAWACNDLAEVLNCARDSAAITHDHPEGIRGAQAIAAAVFLARTGSTKAQIAREITERFGYDVGLSLEQLQERGGFDVRCEVTVPSAIAAFLLSKDFEDAIRIAVSLGGDTDTLASIAGAIAEAHYGIPARLQAEVLKRLDEPLREELKLFAEQFRLVHLANVFPTLMAPTGVSGLPQGVLAEGVSVIVRLRQIHRWLLGGWRWFTVLAPRDTLCADMELVRAGFDSLEAAREFIHRLEMYGLRLYEGGRAMDIILVDPKRGMMAPCQWLELSETTLEPEGPRILAATLRGTRPERVAVPRGWRPSSAAGPQAAPQPTNVVRFRPRPE